MPPSADPAPPRRNFPSLVGFRFAAEDAEVATAAIVVGGLPLPLPLPLPLSVATSDGVAGRALGGAPAAALGLADQLTDGEEEEEAAAAASVCGDPGTLLLLLARCWMLGRRGAEEEER